MRNRAKCKICGETIESLHKNDHVTCKCDMISVFGGEGLYCQAKDWVNFLRVDDNGNEIVPTIAESPPPKGKPTKIELIAMLDEMIECIDKLPDQAMITSINQYDFYSLLVLLSSLFKSDFDSDSSGKVGDT